MDAQTLFFLVRIADGHVAESLAIDVFGPCRVCFGKAGNVDLESVKRGEIVLGILTTQVDGMALQLEGSDLWSTRVETVG